MTITHRIGMTSAAVAVILSSALLLGCAQETPSVLPTSEPDAAAPPAVEQTTRSSVIEGELVRVDADAKLIVLKTAGGFDEQLRYTDQTMVTGATGGVAGLVDTGATRVSVRVTADGPDRVATEITVHPR
jgi:hypothetical protein